MNETKKVSGLMGLLSNRILFIIHLFAYVAVSLLLTLIWGVTLANRTTNYFLPIFPILGWGIGLGFHAIIYLMYNDKVKYLSELRTQSGFKVLFLFHAWFYISVNLFLIVINLTFVTEVIWFFWPLGGWGVAFGFHAFGFFTWDKSFEIQKGKLSKKYPDYSDQRIKELATSKLLGIEILLMHITYFAVVAVIAYTTQIWTLIDVTLASTIQTTLGWSLFLGLHILAYYLFNYVESVSIVMKGLILHLIAYVGLSIIGLWQQFTSGQEIFWWHIPVILWAVMVAMHILFALKWDAINPRTLEKVKSRSPEGLEEYKYQRITYWVVFWRGTFLAHIIMYFLGLILLLPITNEIVDITFETITITSIELLGITALGWLIALLVHGAMYLVVMRNVRGFLMWTAYLHLAAYIGAIPLIITLNMLLLPEFLWSAIALGGWGIGLGAHILIAYLIRGNPEANRGD